MWSVEWQTGRLGVMQQSQRTVFACAGVAGHSFWRDIVYVLRILDVVYKLFTLLHDCDMRITATAALVTTTASPCNEKKR